MSARGITRIVLVAGPVRRSGPRGHHDYVAGCRLLADLLGRVPGVRPMVVANGWPDDESVLCDAHAILCYEGGHGKQGFLQTPERLHRMREALARGAGVVMLHQAVAFPERHHDLAAGFLGGVYVAGQSKRGHWKASHDVFPPHPVTRGVTPWSHRDGWLNGFEFPAPASVTPLLWSNRGFGAARGEHGVVSWAYERPAGGRSFAFTGLDAHAAWSHAGLRRLIANAALWVGGREPPAQPDWTRVDAGQLAAYLSPSDSRWSHRLRKLGRKAYGVARGQRKW